MASSIGIVGASGYGGAELLRLLHGHPAMDATVIAASSQAGRPVAELFPNFADGLADGTARVFDAVDVEQLSTLDLVFLATPHGPAIEIGSQLADAGVRVIDFSAGFRLSAADFATWYGEEHPRPDLLPAVYGLPEFHREKIIGATLLANPGCYTTTTQIGLVPLAHLVVAGTVSVVGMSGLSGAGRTPKDSLHFSHAHADVVAYGAPTHRHTGEIEHGVAIARPDVEIGPVTFVPHLVPMSRGLAVTTTAELREGVTAAQVQDALVAAYAAEPFVHVLPSGTFPHTGAVAGSNGSQVSAVVDPRTRRVVITSVTDNLGKGAAGQALQNANLMLGLDEGLGLTAVGTYP